MFEERSFKEKFKTIQGSSEFHVVILGPGNTKFNPFSVFSVQVVFEFVIVSKTLVEMLYGYVISHYT